VKFHVEMAVRDNFDPMSAVPVQKMVFAHLIKLMDSGRVKDTGMLANQPGGFLMVDAPTPEELFDMLSPLGASMRIQAQPSTARTSMKLLPGAYEKTMVNDLPSLCIPGQGSERKMSVMTATLRSK
jgi:hypothetical protein